MVPSVQWLIPVSYTHLLIGATVVSIGTTLPEVMVSTMSALSGHGEIAYGNAIGSVICNAAPVSYTHLDVYKRQDGYNRHQGHAGKHHQSQRYAGPAQDDERLSLIHI